MTKLKDDLVKLKPGGINVEAVEAVKVHFKPMSQTWAGRKLGKDIRDRQEKKEKGTTVRVGDLAQVLVRGRVCVLMVGEKEVCCSSFFSFLFFLDSFSHVCHTGFENISHSSRGVSIHFNSRPLPSPRLH